MNDHDDVQHRIYHQAPPEDVELRESDDDDGVFRVRMPIASTGEVRNQGDDPLSDEELDGMSKQVAAGGTGVFLDHGMNFSVAESRYSATEKVGEWEEPETQQRDADDGDVDVLYATARLMDPETLPDAVGAVREALTVIKEQAKREMSLSASIGWRDDDAYPGGVDLMETSIVGIPADPRTTSQGAAVATARAVLQGADGVDDETAKGLVEEFRAVVMGSDDSEGQQARDSVTDEETSADDESADETRDEEDGIGEREFREQMLEMQRQQTETLESIRQDDDDDEDDEDEEEEDDDEDDDEDEQSADVDSESNTDVEDTQDADDGETRTVEIDGEELDVDDVVDDHRETLAALREGGIDLEDLDVQAPGEGATPDDEENRDSTDDDTSSDPTGWLA